MKTKLLTSLLLALLTLLHLPAVAQRDSIQFGLITCSPSSSIYAQYGHTALRYQNFSRGEDWVFNYGTFSFNTPNFIYRFVTGETDYRLGVVPYEHFIREYIERGSSVTEQIINFTKEESYVLLDLLHHDCLPENTFYRYNYFYNNCTTRARDRIEAALNGQVTYPETLKEVTFRTILHQHNNPYPWDQFGIDLCLGADCDKPIDARLQMYAPSYMQHYADQATIANTDGTQRPFVRATHTLVEGRTTPTPNYLFKPHFASFILLLLTLLILQLQFRIRRHFWAFDLVLFTLQGVAGIIVAFLFFFSAHPTVDSNWIVLLLNPLPLLALPWVIYCGLKRKFCPYHYFNLATTISFIGAYFIVNQEIPHALLTFSFTQLSYSANQWRFYEK